MVQTKPAWRKLLASRAHRERSGLDRSRQARGHLVVRSRDIMQMPEHEILDAKVVMILVAWDAGRRRTWRRLWNIQRPYLGETGTYPGVSTQNHKTGSKL
jgi:hypothetical protein